MGGSLKELVAFDALQVRGLMTLAVISADLDRFRRSFGIRRALRDRLREDAPDGMELEELSMGMSGAYEVAIEEGATTVRFGQGIFGERPTRDGVYWPEASPAPRRRTGRASLVNP